MAQQYDDALHMMECQGGSFVKSLAACYYSADSIGKSLFVVMKILNLLSEKSFA